MTIDIQTHPKKESDGKVLIVLHNNNVAEVVSDLQLDVIICDSDSEYYKSFPSRPLWEFLRLTTIKLLKK